MRRPRYSRAPSTVGLGLVLSCALLLAACVKTGPVPGEAIAEIYASAAGGRTWYANWDNGHGRTLTSGQRDPYDPLVRARGNGKVEIDGAGTATISGQSPRIYVYDENHALKWQNIEVTVYGRRGGEPDTINSQGLVIGGRSEHQDSNLDVCAGQTYFGRLLYDGRVDFQKEIVHHGLYSRSEPPKATADWSAYGGQFPSGAWVGLKLIITNVDNNSVRLELFRDLTSGKRGGNWELLAEYVDTGDWSTAEVEEAAGFGCPDVPPVFLDPATSVYLRNDAVTAMSYRGFSIREIDPSRRLR